MSFRTYDHMDVPEWEQALALYHASFPEHGRKPDRVIAGMFEKRMCRLHVEVSDDGGVTAMAITGKVPDDLLLIDYLAVREALRGRGIGRRFVADIAEWAEKGERLKGLLLEAEADPGAENAERLRFWERCGFVPTAYVHPYIWVPETYRAMYLSFDGRPLTQDDGRSLFRRIEAFHRKAFTR